MHSAERIIGHNRAKERHESLRHDNHAYVYMADLFSTYGQLVRNNGNSIKSTRSSVTAQGGGVALLQNAVVLEVSDLALFGNVRPITMFIYQPDWH
jgi:hypothetical protein